MYKLLLKRFFKSKTTYLALGLLFVLGIISIAIGKQFLDQQYNNISKIVDKQEEHFKSQLEHHPKDLGLLMYYVKFAYVNKIDNLAGIAIGQRDMNANIQRIGMLNLESQKYDTDLINPMRLQVGNLDLSFVIVFLFPLIIIALTFNLFSEEVEKGTWKMIRIQGKSPISFLLLKLSVRFIGILSTLLLLFLIAKFTLNIEINSQFFSMILLSILYLIFWFSVSLLIISFQKNSNFNAISLLTLWVLIVVLLPIASNKYVTNKYPIGDALSMTIKQRDGYHKKWDTDKKATMDKFYKHYPQFKEYGVIDKGFSWLWYYAMQQMGDDESKTERDAIMTNVKNRQKLSEVIANFVPPIKLQLSLNEIAQTDLNNFIDFLEATTKFHEKIRLDFYPKIFSNQLPSSADFKKYKPEFYTSKINKKSNKAMLAIIVFIMILSIIGIFRIRKYN